MQNQYVSRNGFRKRKLLTNAATSVADLVVCPTPTAQMSLVLATALTGATETSVVITTAIPAYFPKVGSIYVTRDNGTTSTITYSARSGSTFTITSSDFSTTTLASAGNAVHIGIPNRVVITAWSVSAVNTGTAATISLRNKSTTASVLHSWHMIATTGVINVSQDDLTMAGEAGETLELSASAQSAGNFNISVEGYFIPASVPLLNEYTGVP